MVTVTIYYFRCPHCGRYIYALTPNQAKQYATVHLKTQHNKTQHNVNEEVEIKEKTVELE